MSAGPLELARTLAADLIALGKTRFELFGVELREELARLSIALLGGLAVLILAALGVAFLAIAVLIAVAPDHRLAAACAVAAVFIAAGRGLAWALAHNVRTRKRAFDATLSELARDVEAIKP